MAKRTGPTNTQLRSLITELRAQASMQKVALWRRLADDLEVSSRQRRHVNLHHIARHCKENDFVVVPGKVLGTGDAPHKVNIAAFTFSQSAKEKITKAHGECLTIRELVTRNPKARDLRIIG